MTQDETPDPPEVTLPIDFFGAIAAAFSAAPAVPFEPDAATVFDALPVGTVVTLRTPTKATARGSAGESIHVVAAGEPLYYLPVGTTVEITANGALATTPATPTGGQTHTLGVSVADALYDAWIWCAGSEGT